MGNLHRRANRCCPGATKSATFRGCANSLIRPKAAAEQGFPRFQRGTAAASPRRRGSRTDRASFAKGDRARLPGTKPGVAAPPRQPRGVSGGRDRAPIWPRARLHSGRVMTTRSQETGHPRERKADDRRELALCSASPEPVLPSQGRTSDVPRLGSRLSIDRG